MLKMPEVYGVGDFRYEFVEDWAKLPDGVNFQECPGVALRLQRQRLRADPRQEPDYGL